MKPATSKKSVVIILVLLSFFMTGCSVLGPVSSPEFGAMIKNANPEGAGDIKTYGPVWWYPNTRGFNDARGLGISRSQDPIPGILVVTTKEFFIEQWDENEKKYQITKRFSLAEKKEISLDSYGLNRRVVVQWKDFSTDSFSFTSEHGQWVDAPKTEALFNQLSTERK
jgi:hypothetical protein